MNRSTLIGIFNGSLVRRISEAVCTLQTPHLAIHALGKLRRFYLFHCRKGYVQRQLAMRKGECRQCGRCCALLFVCPQLTCEGLCRSYDTWRWEVCKVFPITQSDIAEIALLGGQCGYRFDGPP